jgi:hypothetical protein
MDAAGFARRQSLNIKEKTDEKVPEAESGREQQRSPLLNRTERVGNLSGPLFSS